jgi:hypothetical protein
MDAASVVLDDSTIASHVKRVRRKFHEVDPAFDAVQTVYGMAGAHGAFSSALFPDSHRRFAWLVGAAEEEDSFPLTDGERLPADRMFFAALTCLS